MFFIIAVILAYLLIGVVYALSRTSTLGPKHPLWWFYVLLWWVDWLINKAKA